MHTDLLDNEKIKDPFYRLNEHELQWIDKKDWVYKTELFVNSEEFNKDRIVLDFKGLDTYADVFVNDSLVLSADNMFIGWTVDVKKYLKEGNNDLRVYFRFKH